MFICLQKSKDVHWQNVRELLRNPSSLAVQKWYSLADVEVILKSAHVAMDTWETHNKDGREVKRFLTPAEPNLACLCWKDEDWVWFQIDNSRLPERWRFWKVYDGWKLAQIWNSIGNTITIRWKRERNVIKTDWPRIENKER